MSEEQSDMDRQEARGVLESYFGDDGAEEVLAALRTLSKSDAPAAVPAPLPVVPHGRVGESAPATPVAPVAPVVAPVSEREQREDLVLNALIRGDRQEAERLRTDRLGTGSHVAGFVGGFKPGGE